MKMSARLLVAAVVSAPWVPLASADPFDAVRASIHRRLAEDNVPAIAVAVWRDGKIVWEEGFGWADRERRVAADEHTPFSIASLSKTLTAVGLMTLVQAGKVELDRPANDYLGPDQLTSWLPGSPAVTVRQLANHTSGLPGKDEDFYGEERALLPPMSLSIQRYGAAMTLPGERYRYSNFGYGVLGHLIGRVSRQGYADYMRQHVFLPLGMTRSSVGIAPGLEPFRAQRYDFDRNPVPEFASSDPGAGSVYASAHDLARFGMFLLKNPVAGQTPVLNAENIDRMSATPVAIRPGVGYGVGMNVVTGSGYRVIGHAGSMSGVHSDFAVVPEANLGVAVLANADGGGGDLRDEILATLLPKWRTPPAAPVKPAMAPSPAMIGRWQGQIHTYEGLQPIQLQIQASGDVHVRIGGEPRFANRSTLQQAALVNDVKFGPTELRGTSLARIETSDTKRYPHTVAFSLQLRGDKLSGMASAVSVYDGLWIYALPYWAELSRVAP